MLTPFSTENKTWQLPWYKKKRNCKNALRDREKNLRVSFLWYCAQMTTEDFPLLYYLFIGPPWAGWGFCFFLHFHGFIHEQQTASKALLKHSSRSDWSMAVCNKQTGCSVWIAECKSCLHHNFFMANQSSVSRTKTKQNWTCKNV